MHSKTKTLLGAYYEPVTILPSPTAEAHRVGTKDLDPDHPTYLQLSHVQK